VNKLHLSHAKFSILFSALLYVVCNAINIGALAKWFHDKDGLNYWALGAYMVAGLCLLIVFVMLLAHRWTIKPVAILLLVFSAAVTYFISKYNVAIDSSMVLNAMHTDPTEVGQLLSLQMVPYVLFLIAVPALLVFYVRIDFAPSWKYLVTSVQVIGVALLLALSSLYLQYNAILLAGNISKKYTVYSLVPINIIAGSFSAVSKQLRPYFAKASVPITGQIASPDNLVVVLAIGESSRRQNFSVYGYDRRDTTPVLKSTSGLHLLNGLASRGSTIYALPRILEKNGIKLTALTSKLGVPTSCLVNYTLYDNCSSVGEIKATECGHGGKCYDEDVLPLLDQELGKYASGYKFVVLHLGGGSHGPIYSDRYPAEFQQFQPMCTDADVANQCTVEQLFNSYDNTILYVDHVVGKVIGTLDRSGVPYVFIYLSDHGESLMEGGRMFHGMPPGVALPPEQAQIPLIVKSSIPISIAPRTEYPQEAVFDSIVDLFSIRTPLLGSEDAFIRKQVSSAASTDAEPPLERVLSRR
jgi:lipid A ethanolaminephosphotransferase